MLSKAWVQPILTSYTSFGTLSVKTASADYHGWHASDGVTNVQAHSWEATINDVPSWLKWLLPYPIKISSILFYNKYTGNTRLTQAISVYADEAKTKFIGTGTFPAATPYGTTTVNAVEQFESDVLYLSLDTSYNLQVGLTEMVITATVSGEFTLVSPPTKLVYVVGEALDLDGMVVAGIYDDSTEETITDYTVSGYDPSVVGQQTVYVAYAGDSVSFDVTVNSVPVTSVTLDTHSSSLNIGGTLQLAATVLPPNATDPSIVWSSSNSAVATVLNGLVTAVASGTATVMVQATDGSLQSDSCFITVINPTPSSDDLYNSTDRVIQQKFIVHFQGSPLTITRDNYLISSSVLEETQSDIKSYLGNTTSNELDLSIYNDRRIFTPTNTDSPYYGKIVKGLKIESFVRAYTGVDSPWDSLGVFYVTSWVASAEGLVVNITANDSLYRVLQSPQPSFAIRQNMTHKALFETYLTLFGANADVDSTLTQTLSYAYINSTSPKTFLTELALGAMSDCFCDRNDNVRVRSKIAPRDLRATFTDNDQIISASISQSIDTGYDGSKVTCNSKQESSPAKVLSIKNAELESGTTVYENVALTTSVLVRLSYISVVGLNNIEIRNISATPSQISFDAYNASATQTLSDITVYGNTLETVSTVLADTGDELLKLDSDYVQDLAYANEVKEFVDRIAANKIPTLTIKARGNPLLSLGDLIHIDSIRYKLDYDGILIRATYDYDGGLKATYVFAAAQAFLEVI